MFVSFIRAWPGHRRVYSGLFGSFGRALGMFVFIQCHLVRSSATNCLSGSFGDAMDVVAFIWALPEGRRFHS